MPIVGPPAFPGGKNRQAVLNQQWVAALCREVCEPIYDKASSAFYIYNPETGVWERKTTAEMVALISRIITKIIYMRYYLRSRERLENLPEDLKQKKG